MTGSGASLHSRLPTRRGKGQCPKQRRQPPLVLAEFSRQFRPPRPEQHTYSRVLFFSTYVLLFSDQDLSMSAVEFLAMSALSGGDRRSWDLEFSATAANALFHCPTGRASITENG